MPTLSFKDRGAAVLVSYIKSLGIKSVVQDSSGNAGNSVAAYCGRVGIDCEIFVPEGTSDKKICMIEAHGAKAVVVPGNRDHCAEVCREKVEKEGIYYANHVYNPFFYEGTKTYIYETYEQMGRIPEILAYINKYKVQGVVIPEDKILPAREKIARQGIYCEHTTAAVYAGYERYCEEHGEPDEALLSMCGAGLKSDHG